ncbi:hypothetical protein [Sporosarcina sp. P13]|uniref:hypothetical protein n=1 Tax=Sporosarcina sp. P13 TaxID=2048263 RepID=UPI001E3F1EA1|nr:hypothetical protein [Sporosarcina sp. P13]
MKGKARIFTLVLFISGMIIHFLNGNRGFNLLEGITQNLALLTILILAPLISIPLKHEGIIDSIVFSFTKNLNDERKSFYGVSSFMLLLTPILNMGSIRIVHGFVGNIGFQPKILTSAYFTGFTFAVLWSPFFASVGIVISILHISYMSYFFVGVIFAFIQVVVAILLLRPKASIYEKTENTTEQSAEIEVDTSKSKNILLLLAFVLGLLLLLIGMESLLKKPMLLLVSFICILVPLVWILFRRKWSVAKSEYKLFKSNLLLNNRMEITLFLSAGLFGNAIANTPMVNVLGSIIEWSVQESLAILFSFILLFVTAMAIIGVHQIISVPLILMTLVETGIAYNPITIAFMCVFSWMLSSSVSPLNALNIIISQNARENGVKVAIMWHGIYFLTTTCIAFMYIYIIDFLT